MDVNVIVGNSKENVLQLYGINITAPPILLKSWLQLEKNRSCTGLVNECVFCSRYNIPGYEWHKSQILKTVNCWPHRIVQNPSSNVSVFQVSSHAMRAVVQSGGAL